MRSDFDDPTFRANGLGWFGGILFLALCAQFVLLAVSFSDETSVRAVMHSIPDVCSTHAGGILLASCGIAAALCAAAWIPSARRQRLIWGPLVLCCIALHAFVGHAASDGTFSLAELYQLIHLFGMALWSGGIIVSGVYVLPRLRRTIESEHTDGPFTSELKGFGFVREYLGRLSDVSTWAVCAVVLSGVAKSYHATEGSLQAVRSSSWGHVLLVKIGMVTLTVTLGARNRWLLASQTGWSRASMRSAVSTLRAESFSMFAVLILSTWLANSPPPLE